MAQDAYVAPSIQASSATFTTLQSGGLRGMVDAVIAANPAIANPTTAPTVSATGGGASGGNLPAGTYFVSYTWFDGAGETIAKESATSFTIAAGNIPQATIPATPTGAAGANIYLTAAGGASGTEVRYASGVTSTTFNMSYAGPADPTYAPASPASNTTGAATIAPKLHKAAATGGLDLEWIRLSTLISQYIQGTPVAFGYTRDEILRIDYAYLLWHEAVKEALALIAANPGTIKTVQGATVPKTYRAVGSIS